MYIEYIVIEIEQMASKLTDHFRNRILHISFQTVLHFVEHLKDMIISNGQCTSDIVGRFQTGRKRVLKPIMLNFLDEH